MIRNNYVRMLFLVLACGLFSLSSLAYPSDKAKMRRQASSALNIDEASSSLLREVEQHACYSIFSADDAGFAVVTSIGDYPRVLAYSHTAYPTESNPNFQWWLRCVDEVLASSDATTSESDQLTPGSLGYPDTVGPIVAATWGQEYPYNMLCPSSGGMHCMTGCVATAMSQILYTLRTPHHGYSHRTIYYPYNNKLGQPISTVFADTQYQWDQMVDSYANSTGNESSNLAVATLVRDCGIAANMQYGISSSGATHKDAAEGLRDYFGITTAEWKERRSYSQTEWMSMIYDEISSGRPIIYGGVDANPMSGISGHSFVLHGYDEHGLVYVNWGWEGIADGYFDVSILNPLTFRFNTSQDMVIGIAPKNWQPLILSIHLTPSQTLSEALGDDAMLVTSLSVEGSVTAEDINFLRTLATDKGILEHLDLSKAILENDALPDFAFCGCTELCTLSLPSTLLKWGKAALSNCPQLRLKTIKFDDSAAREFIVYDGCVMSRDGLNLIEVLPCSDTELKVPRGTTNIGTSALSSLVRTTKISLPSSITSISDKALSNCWSLTELRVAAQNVPELGANVFDDVDIELCHLYVPRNTINAYISASQWNVFEHTIFEFGTTIKARNATREQYQENPEFGYQMQGDYVEGEPELFCEATYDSPPGRYPIQVFPGTIVAECVDYVDGYLVVVESTGIEDVAESTAEDDMYTLSGVRITGDAADSSHFPRGLYLKRGKKMLVKH